ncbi:MAG: phage tail protein I [Hyphomicrobiales bacterium]|nr:phage tail protein I [Hyphomicrobiales bacterium]
MSARVEASIIPPSISDERGRAFGEVMAQALAEPDFKQLLFERIDEVDADLLPFLVREFSLEEFVEPEFSDDAIRNLLKGSFALHARKGFIDGVRTGLGFLGIRVVAWRQWFELQPPGAPGTHTVTLTVDDVVFAAGIKTISLRLQRLASRMVEAMKRASQDVGIRFAAESATPVFLAAQPISRIAIRPSVDPITMVSARPPVFIAAAIMSRLRIAPQVPNG